MESILGICIDETFSTLFFFASLSLRILLPRGHHNSHSPLHTLHFAHLPGSSLLSARCKFYRAGLFVHFVPCALPHSCRQWLVHAVWMVGQSAHAIEPKSEQGNLVTAVKQMEVSLLRGQVTWPRSPDSECPCLLEATKLHSWWNDAVVSAVHGDPMEFILCLCL